MYRREGNGPGGLDDWRGSVRDSFRTKKDKQDQLKGDMPDLFISYVSAFY